MTKARSPEAWMHALLLCFALGIGAYLRLRNLAGEALFGDELHSITQASESLGSILRSFDSKGSHVVLPLLQHVSLACFGDGLLAFRMPALIPGLLSLLLAFPIGCYLVGRTPALLATLALALSPMHVYYSRFARSYALSTLLGMLLVYCLARALESSDGSRKRRYWTLSFALAACMPYVHLSSAGFVGLAAVVAILCAWRRAGRIQAALMPLLGFGLALALCLAAYGPIMDQVQSYLNEAMPEALKKSPTTLMGIPILLAGSTPAAVLMLILLPPALFALGRQRSCVALLMASSLLGPILALLITKPHGMEYAYARYLLGGLPFIPMAIAWLLLESLKKCRPLETKANALALLVGVSVLVLGFVMGPALGARPATPVFDNSYLAMHRLPAFDTPWPARHAFYEQLAAEADTRRIVEYPVLQTRAALYYRQMAFVHGKQVLLGYHEALQPGMGSNVYVSLQEVSARHADYVILHRDPASEVRNYWKHVYDQVGPEADWGLQAGFLRRHRMHLVEQEITRTDFLASEAARLRNRLGAAYYKDDQIIVWKLRD